MEQDLQRDKTDRRLNNEKPAKLTEGAYSEGKKPDPDITLVHLVSQFERICDELSEAITFLNEQLSPISVQYNERPQPDPGLPEETPVALRDLAIKINHVYICMKRIEQITENLRLKP